MSATSPGSEPNSEDVTTTQGEPGIHSTRDPRSAAPTTQPPWFKWNAKWDPDTTKLAYEESIKLQAVYTDWIKAVEGKIVTVFTVSSAAITVSASLRASNPLRWSMAVWAGALVAYIIAIAFCLRAYKVRRYRLDLNPQSMLEDIGRNLRRAFFFAAAEVVCIGMALMMTS
jgi:hypothetical protein